MKKIARDEFFYVVKDNYDDHVDLAIHHYKEMHEEIKYILPKGLKSPKILDLGCGTGYTAATILDIYPESRIIAIDLFDEMIAHAKHILSKYTDNIAFVTGDFRTVEWENDIDICVSALALHHILNDEKMLLFKKIADSLTSNGMFILLDWVKAENAEMNELAYQQALRHLNKYVTSHETIDDWASHWKEKNIPNTIDETFALLKLAGFKSMDVVYKYFNLSLIITKL
jgi:ubiquinone/menaquinone biosynthesis C-methylase UbiE